jgi:AcrR family transcriptional regulator
MDDIIVNKKQTDIIASAQRLFWKYGFKKVTIEEICREAKVSKVTFYKFFPNKTEVAKAVLDSVVDNANKDFILLIQTATTTLELMEGMFKMKKDGVHDISKEFLADFYTDKTLGLGEYFGLKIQQIWTQVREGYIQLQEKGLIRKDLNLDFLLYFSNKLTDLFEDPYLLSLFPNTEDLLLEFTNLFTFGMTPRPLEQ